MSKRKILVVTFVVGLILISFSIPNNGYSNKTRYLFTNSNIFFYSINTNDFSTNGMIFTAFIADPMGSIYYNDINYTQQNINKDYYLIPNNLPVSQSINVNSYVNQTPCTSWTYTSSTHESVSCSISVLDYFNFYQTNTRLFLIETSSTVFLVFTNENGQDLSIIQIPASTNPPITSLASGNGEYNSIPFDMFFQHQNTLYLVYENESAVIFSSINTNAHSITENLALNYSEYGNYTRTIYYDGNIYVSFEKKIVEVEPQSNTLLSVKELINSTYYVSNFSPFDGGLFYSNYPHLLNLYNASTDSILEIHNFPLSTLTDYVAINNSALFISDMFEKTMIYVSFSYNQTNILSNETNNTIGYFQTIKNEINSTQSNYYFGIYNNLNVIKLAHSKQNFVISFGNTPYGLNIYLNTLYTFPDFSSPPFNWIDFLFSLPNAFINQLNIAFLNNSSLILLLALASMDIILLTSISVVISKLYSKWSKNKEKHFVDQVKDETVSSNKTIISTCRKCGFTIILGDQFCQKCGSTQKIE